MVRTTTGSLEGNGHHLSSNAGPLSTQRTISQCISPASSDKEGAALLGPAPSTSIASSIGLDGLKIQIWMLACEGRCTREPIIGE